MVTALLAYERDRNKRLQKEVVEIRAALGDLFAILDRTDVFWMLREPVKNEVRRARKLLGRPIKEGV